MKNVLENLNKINKIEVLKQDFIYDEKDSIQELLDVMNIIMLKTAKKNVLYLNCIPLVEKTKKELKSNGNFEMCMDNLLLSLWEEINEKHSRS